MDDSSLNSTEPPQFYITVGQYCRNSMDIPMLFYTRFIRGKYQGMPMIVFTNHVSSGWQFTWENNRVFGEDYELFLKVHHLKDGDIMLFRHDGHMTFQVSLFGPNGCEIRYKLDVAGRKLDRDGLADYNLGTEDRATCNITVTESNIKRNRVYIPSNFSKHHGLHTAPQSHILLVNYEKNTWEAILKSCVDDRVQIVGSWTEFCAYNSLQIGESYRFKLVKINNMLSFELCNGSNR